MGLSFTFSDQRFCSYLCFIISDTCNNNNYNAINVGKSTPEKFHRIWYSLHRSRGCYKFRLQRWQIYSKYCVAPTNVSTTPHFHNELLRAATFHSLTKVHKLEITTNNWKIDFGFRLFVLFVLPLKNVLKTEVTHGSVGVFVCECSVTLTCVACRKTFHSIPFQGIALLRWMIYVHVKQFTKV